MTSQASLPVVPLKGINGWKLSGRAGSFMSAAVQKIVMAAERRFGPHIDMSDRASMPPPKREEALRSRCIAALCIQNLSDCDDATAGGAVTDGHADNGIDAFYFDQTNDQFIFVTSEYNKDGRQGIAAAKVGDFLSGVQRIVSDDYGDLNEKINRRRGEIENALGATRDVQTVIVVATTSTQPLSQAATQHVTNFIKSNYNELPELCRHEYFGQRRLYRALVPQVEDVNIQIRLANWGEVRSPYQAFYGSVAVSEIAQWWQTHGPNLYAKNIRALQADSSVNEAIERTVRSEPKNFWYFNNGITIVCKSINRTPKIGAVLPLNCVGLSIVNGAQTVGTIGRALQQPDALQADSDSGWVHVRLIELGDDNTEFHRRITQANNLQNAVTKRDFAGMDPVQHKIANDFALANRRYVYKSGEVSPRGEEGCDLTEAAQALACAASGVYMAVQVKREIGQLWDSDRPLYRNIFRPSMDSDRVWRAVLVLRAVDEQLAVVRNESTKNANLVCVHLNRIILHLVFRGLHKRRIKFQTHDLAELIEQSKLLGNGMFQKVIQVLQEKYPKESLGTLSKNFTKCSALVSAILPESDDQPDEPLLPFLREEL